MPRPYRLRLFDMLNAIAICERTTARDFDAFQTDDLAGLATERALEIMSEASRHIPELDKAQYPDVEWRDLADLGNVLRHGYDRVLPERVFLTAKAASVRLKPVVESLYTRHKSPADPWPDATPHESKSK